VFFRLTLHRFQISRFSSIGKLYGLMRPVSGKHQIDSLENLRLRLAEFAQQRDWQQFQSQIPLHRQYAG